MKALRLVLFPFSLLYAFIVFIRNFLFDRKILSSREFDFPVISVGNLAVGGAGKSPVTEYIVRLLKDNYRVATLSRGYGRRTKGFLRVECSSAAYAVGDEPLQFKRKFPDISVAVCENRIVGIEKLMKGSEAIIMDDAYQHRAVKPGLSLLLFEYNQLFSWQWYLPTGNLRESWSGRKRADVIVITKCPVNISEAEKRKAIQKVAPLNGQSVFFSYLEYADLMPAGSGSSIPLTSLDRRAEVILLTGIANAKPLVGELKKYISHLVHHEYPDHHLFSRKNIIKLAEAYNQPASVKKYIITTEKDMQRLRTSPGYELLMSLPVYYLPVSARMFDPGSFNHVITSYVTKYRYNC